MTALAAVSTPCTQTVVEFLATLRRHLRFNDTLDKYVNEVIRFAVRGTEAPRKQPNPSPGTACWSFRGKPGAHLIHFCLRLFERMKAGADWRKCITAYAEHEVSHACFTWRDLKALNKELAAVKVPFSELNLFEDARIEHHGREKLGFEMAWRDFEDLKPAETPRQYFFNLIQNMGVDAPDLMVPEVAAEPWVFRVRDYYFAGALKADRFKEMKRLLQEWVAEFPLPPGFKVPFGQGDLEASLTIELDEELSAAIAALADDQDPPQGGAGRVEPHSITLDPGYSTDPIIKDEPVRTVDLAQARKVSDRLSMLLAPRTTRERCSQPTKHLSTRAFVAGREDFYRRKVPTGHGRPIQVVQFIDCSGSMGILGPDGKPAIDGAISLGLGFSGLAERGLVQGHIVLHKGLGKQAYCAVYKLPLPLSFFARIPSDGGCEALEPALKRASELLQKADYVFCSTDGSIGDKPVDKAWLARKGVRPIGLYSGNAELAESLSEWFSCVVIRPTLLDLLDGMVAVIDFAKFGRRQN